MMLTLTEAAALAGTDPSALRHAIREGRLTATKRGASWLVGRDELERYLHERRTWRRRAGDGDVPPPACVVPGCGRPREGRGLCHRHYMWHLRHPEVELAAFAAGDPIPSRPALDDPAPERGTCSVDGCDRPASRRGYCEPHYRRMLRTGNTDPERPIRDTSSPARVRCQVAGCPNAPELEGYRATHAMRRRRRG